MREAVRHARSSRNGTWLGVWAAISWCPTSVSIARVLGLTNRLGGLRAYAAGLVESYPRCGAEACSAPLPAAFDGSEKSGNLTFTMQMSANQDLLPFGQNQKWAIGNATLALLLPVLGEP